jgi:hypothetical protein
MIMGYENTSGRNVLDHYGPRTTTGKFGGVYGSKEPVKTAEWKFDYNDLPGGGVTSLETQIPANARIISAKLEIITAFTSTSTTTDLLIGLEQGDGTAIDVDGLISAAEATQTAIATAGNVIDGAGTLVGATIGAAAGELVVAPNVDDLLTGRGRVLVEYLPAGV